MEDIKSTDWKNLFLSFDGRIGRREYWIGVAVLFGVLVAASIVVSILAAIIPPFALLMMPVSLAALYPGAAVAAKRWHDRGKSGWWSLVVLVPFVGGLYAIWELGIQPGVETANDYGENPLLAASA